MTAIEQRMETGLDHIRGELRSVGDAVEAALQEARRALFARDARLAHQVVLGDYPVNRKARNLDSRCHDFIGGFMPGAGALREVTATIRVNVILERIGDHAVTIARESLRLERDLPAAFRSMIENVADESTLMLANARTAFRKGDSEAAAGLMQGARRLEARMDGVYEALFAEEDRLDATTTMVIFVVFNLYKRIADQARNICEQTVYAVRGIDQFSRNHRVLFLAPPESPAASLALAIGRGRFAEAVEFDAATPGMPDTHAPGLEEFLAGHGLSVVDDIETLDSLSGKLPLYSVIVGLGRPVSDCLDKAPFHTSVLDWDIGEDVETAFQELEGRISALVTLLTGFESEPG